MGLFCRLSTKPATQLHTWHLTQKLVFRAGKLVLCLMIFHLTCHQNGTNSLVCVLNVNATQ